MAEELITENIKNSLRETFKQLHAGGQIAITPVVENSPGFARIAGKTLGDMMAKQTLEYAPILQGFGVNDIKRKDGGFEMSTAGGHTMQKQ